MSFLFAFVLAGVSMLCKLQQTTSVHAVHLWILCVHSLFCLHLESHIDNLTPENQMPGSQESP